MRIPLSQLLLLLFAALAFVAGCNPPSNPTCSSSIGQATINEVSKVQANASNSNSLDDANDFIEIKIINTALSASTLNNWNVLVCEKGSSNCYGGALSSATITTATDGSGARYYVLKSLSNIGRQINFAVGTEIALSDQNDYAVDYLSVGGYLDHKPSCTFSYDYDAATTSTTRRVRRNGDGTGNWETVTANDQPATEGLHNTASPSIVAEWRMEQASWSGSSGEAVATTSSLNGTARNSATTANTTPNPALNTNPGSCRYGRFTSSSNQYLTIPDDDILDFSTSSSNFTAMSVAAWIYPKTASTQGTIVAKGLATSATAGDYMYALRLYNSTRLDFTFCSATSSGNCSAFNTVSATSPTSLLNTWTHVAVSFHSGYQKIYLNGVEASISNNSVVGVPLTNSRPLFVGNSPNSATSPSAYFYPFDGAIDELRFYRAALTQAQAQAAMSETHACGPPTVDHFAIAPASTTAVTCDAVAVTLTPHTSGEATLTNYTGTVALGATLAGSASGSWELISGTAANFTSTGTGTANYKFAAGETAATLRYKNTNAGVVSFTASDGVASASENGTVTFSNAGFVFLVNGANTSVPTQISGKDSNAGWNGRSLSIRAVTTNPATGVCVNRLPAGTQAIEFAYSCVNPASCSAGAVFNIAGTAAATAIPANAGAPGSAQSINLTFDGNATAPFVANYNDAGQVRLYVRKVLGNDSNGPAATLTGNTTINMRPFAFGFANIVSGATSNPKGTASSGSGFVAAGTVFSATLGAYRYVAGQDADADGKVDSNIDVTTAGNGLTPNFTMNNVAITKPSGLLTPALASGGVEGALSAPTSVNLSSGTAALSNMTYSEVGSLRLHAVVDSYLGVSDGGFEGDSVNIGRFFPQDFELVTSAVTAACTASSPAFTYFGQPFSISHQLRARNSAGAVTRNYDTSAGYSVGTLSYVAENADSGVSLTSRISVGSPAGVWDGGVYVTGEGATNFSNSAAVLARGTAMTTAQAGPYNSLQMGMVLTDTDGRTIASMDMNANTSGSCAPASCFAKMIGSPTTMRYGRLALRNTSGSDQARAIVIPALVEFFNNGQFERNEADSCTQYGNSQINDVNYSGALASSYNDARDASATTYTSGHWWLPSSNQTLQNGLFRSEPDGLRITPVAGVTSPPVLGVSLSATVPGTIPAWLLYDWDNNAATAESGPSCTVNLGSYRGHDRVILWRER